MSATPLGSFQAAFFAALLAEPDAVGSAPFASQPGFAVYRNTVMAGCVEALEANYPTLRTLVGETRFGALARAFVRASPPADGVLAAYGEGFAAWLAASAGQVVPALAGEVARLDRAWTESHLAADAPLLDPGTLVALAAGRFAAARLVPHPAARWLALSGPRTFAWWRACRDEPSRALEPDPVLDDDHDDHDRGDGAALLMRPDGAVVWTSIERAAVVFLDACALGRVVAEALEAAAAAQRASDVARWLPALMHARAFTRMDEGRGKGGA